MKNFLMMVGMVAALGCGSGKGGVKGETAELLMSSPWCSAEERDIFTKDGKVEFNHITKGKGTLFWEIKGDTLRLSQDGKEWQEQKITLSKNAEGKDVIKTAEGVEFTKCN